jgi:Fe-S cluster assembly protein SufD
MSEQLFAGIKAVFVNDQQVELRQKHFNALKQLELPKIGKVNTKNMNFTDVKASFEKTNQLNQLTDDVKPFIDDETNIVVVKDGSIIYQNLSEVFKDIAITSYFDAIDQNNQHAIDLLTADLKEDATDRLQAINKAYRNSGLLIEVPKNVVIKDTLKIHIIASRDLVHRTVVIAHPSSDITLLEKIDNINAVQANITTHTEVLPNARVSYLGIDRLCEKTTAYIDRRANVHQDGNLVYALGQLNDGHTVSNNFVKLIGKNANCESRNVLLSDRESIHAVTISIEHLAEHSIGNIINHGIVKDQAYLHIDGVGKIHKGMKASNAQQETHVITLSDESKVDANPYLLIDEYDVFAGHGAGIGQVDEEQLYYMMSRGMSKREAEKLIILGFLYPIIEMIDSDLIKEDFIQTIEKKLSM